MLTRRTPRVLAAACLAYTAFLPATARATPTLPAEPQAAAADVPALVRQLGDADFRTREAATKRLREIGKPAAPALREALTGDDPEVSSRADSLLRQIERPRIPDGWFTDPANWQRRESLRNGARVVLVVERGNRRAQVTEGPTGLQMTIDGVEAGEAVKIAITARDADDLRQQDPDAYAVYERVAGARANLNLRGRRLVPAAPVPPQFRQQLPMPLPPVPGRPPAARLLPLAPEGGLLLRPPADDLLELEARLRRQMLAAGVDDAEQQAVLEAMRMLREIQARGRVLPDDLEAQMQKYNALSDAVRQKLDELKLPGPGDALPPPAHARLGVGVETTQPGDAPGVTVTRVIPGSRGDKLSLQAGDVIRRVNGNPADDPAMLRRVLTDAKGPLVLDVDRGGEAVILKEKPE